MALHLPYGYNDCPQRLHRDPAPKAETREGADVHSGGRSEADGQESDATFSAADHVDGSSEGTESINVAILTQIYADALGRRSADFRGI